MTTVTRTPCLHCEGTGHRKHPSHKTWRDKRRTCSRCGGPGYIEHRTMAPSVDVGPGWFSDAPMPREMRGDVAMLASAIGSLDWPPRS